MKGIVLASIVAGDGFALILGDNIFYGAGLSALCQEAPARPAGATVFAYRVDDPERYSVVEFDRATGEAPSIDQKPAARRSEGAVAGLYYYYDNDVFDIAAAIKASARGELEIININRAYLRRGALRITRLGRRFPGWTRARTQACTRRPPSSARSNIGRA